MTTTTTKHLWAGIERPAHVENSKEWTNTVSDEISAIAEDAVRKVFMMTYGHEATDADEDTITDLTSEVRDVLLKKSRKFGIPVWFPKADSHTF